MEIKTVEFNEKGAHCFSAELFWRELGRNMPFCQKYEIVNGFDKKANFFVGGAADAIRKVV